MSSSRIQFIHTKPDNRNVQNILDLDDSNTKEVEVQTQWNNLVHIYMLRPVQFYYIYIVTY